MVLVQAGDCLDDAVLRPPRLDQILLTNAGLLRFGLWGFWFGGRSSAEEPWLLHSRF